MDRRLFLKSVTGLCLTSLLPRMVRCTMGETFIPTPTRQSVYQKDVIVNAVGIGSFGRQVIEELGQHRSGLNSFVLGQNLSHEETFAIREGVLSCIIYDPRNYDSSLLAKRIQRLSCNSGSFTISVSPNRFGTESEIFHTHLMPSGHDQMMTELTQGILSIANPLLGDSLPIPSFDLIELNAIMGNGAGTISIGSSDGDAIEATRIALDKCDAGQAHLKSVFVSIQTKAPTIDFMSIDELIFDKCNQLGSDVDFLWTWVENPDLDKEAVVTACTMKNHRKA